MLGPDTALRAVQLAGRPVCCQDLARTLGTSAHKASVLLRELVARGDLSDWLETHATSYGRRGAAHYATLEIILARARAGLPDWLAPRPLPPYTSRLVHRMPVPPDDEDDL